jgi:Flp pilus assembly protein TadG
VIRYSRLRTWLKGLAKSGWHDDRASQLVEFAVALPLLVLFVVGIFDFSNAFTLKQKLTNVARDAARAAAADPANDLQSPSPTPASVLDAFQDIENYLVANKINDCGISSSSPAAAGLTWTYTATTGCPPGGLVIVINRGYYFPATSASLPSVNCTGQTPGAGTAVIATCVSIQYAYAWRFGRVASLVGASSNLPSAITVVSVAMNEN